MHGTNRRSEEVNVDLANGNADRQKETKEETMDTGITNMIADVRAAQSILVGSGHETEARALDNVAAALIALRGLPNGN